MSKEDEDMKAIVKNKKAQNVDDFETKKEEAFKNGLRIVLINHFELGDLYQTCGVNNATEHNIARQNEVFQALERYRMCDWGDTCYEDWKMNDDAVKYGDDRIVAKYCLSFGNIFIITEWDRSATTILFCNEY